MRSGPDFQRRRRIIRDAVEVYDDADGLATVYVRMLILDSGAGVGREGSMLAQERIGPGDRLD